MKTMKKWLALALAVSLLLTLAACGKNKKPDTNTNGSTTTVTGGSTTGTTTTTPTTPPTNADGLLPDEEEDGSKDHPFEVGSVLEFDAEVKAGGVTYYNVYRISGTILRLESANATVEYDGTVYQPVDGVISFPVTTPDLLIPALLAIGNTGDADATFKVTFSYPAGNRENPIELSTGDLTTDMEAGNETGVFYTFTAPEDGTMTVVLSSVTDGVDCDIALQNMTTAVNHTLGEDGEEKDGKKQVSVDAKKGEMVQMVVMVNRDSKNQYPAATIKTAVSFDAGEVEEIVTDVTYTVTVKDDTGAVIPGVKLQFILSDESATVTTDENGVASVTMTKADGVVTITMPEGYSGSFTYGISFSTPSITITLEKEKVEEPEEPEQPEITTQDYTVTVLGSKGEAAGGIVVSIYSGDTKVAEQTTNKQGGISVTLNRGSYTVKLSGNTEQYDAKAAVLTGAKPDLTLLLGAAPDTSKTMEIFPPEYEDSSVHAYYLTEGATYVTLTPGVRNYFLFEPTRAGFFRFSASNTSARIGHYGESFSVQNLSIAEVSGNAFTYTWTEDQLGNYIGVIGVDATCDGAVIQITRVGDPAWDPTTAEAVVYTGTAPTPVTAPAGLTDLDIMSSEEHQLVYNESDGYYHLDSANGPVVYVHMNSQYASIMGMLSEFGNMTAYIYNADGTFNRKEQYAPLMQQYVDNMDRSQRVYPLTADLKYMIENYGEAQNWWNAGEPGYLFEEVEGVNPANAWMFLFCCKK